MKLCDFGSAKHLVRGEPNVSYICSRYYRAPELIFGATDYTTNIDVWSAGKVCVLSSHQRYVSGILELGNVLGFVQLIHRAMRTKKKLYKKHKQCLTPGFLIRLALML